MRETCEDFRSFEPCDSYLCGKEVMVDGNNVGCFEENGLQLGRGGNRR